MNLNKGTSKIVGIIVLIILVIVGVIGYYVFLNEGKDLVSENMLRELNINETTLVIEQNIGDLNYIRTEDDGGEAVFFKNKRTNNQVNKEIENLPIYSAVYKNKEYFPESNTGWTDNRIRVMVQEYKEEITDKEFSIFLEANVLHESYVSKTVKGEQIYVLKSSNPDKIYIWKSSDKLILVMPENKEYLEKDMIFLAEVYLNFYPSK